MIKINNIFSIGYRCTNDELLKSMKLREYSGPFSYMVIDYKSALEFIENRFLIKLGASVFLGASFKGRNGGRNVSQYVMSCSAGISSISAYVVRYSCLFAILSCISSIGSTYLVI